MRHMIPMRCPNHAVCKSAGDVVSIEHGPVKRYRGTVWAPTTDPPTCATCGAELEYLDD